MFETTTGPGMNGQETHRYRLCPSRSAAERLVLYIGCFVELLDCMAELDFHFHTYRHSKGNPSIEYFGG